MTESRLVVIIPARYGSSRLPGKPLADICGLPMVVRVAQRASLVQGASLVAVATDDPRISDAVEGMGFPSVLTSSIHPSGTDRIAEAAAILGLSPGDVVINVQGDQPMLDTAAVDKMVKLFLGGERFVMTTVACPMNRRSARDPNRVKVVVGAKKQAIYFSRALIPFDRDGVLRDLESPYLRHLGLYCYRVEFLQRYVDWPQGRLESIERLEQLRVLERGLAIGVAVVEKAPPEVDTMADLETVRRLFKRESS